MRLTRAFQHWLLGVRRDRNWRRVRKLHVKLEPACIACGQTRRVEVHHIIPVHIDATLELEPGNLVTLCRPHHFEIGHHSDWWNYNLDVRYDAAVEKRRVTARTKH